MEFVPIQDVLGPLGLNNPILEVLEPTADLYSVSLFQPLANISYTDTFVKNANDSDHQKFRNFLDHVINENVSLAVTPEYSTPWNVLKSSLDSDSFPAEGKIWVLGMESLSLTELEEFKQNYHEQIQIVSERINYVTGNFLDPACILFRTNDIHGVSRKVLVIQFKTFQMGGDNFERDNLIKGNNIYELRGPNQNSIKLVTLICADSLNLQRGVQNLGTRTLVVHIQLNLAPRHQDYTAYRKAIFNIEDDSEIICLNWASNIEFVGQRQENPSLSALYLKSDDLNLTDERIRNNHSKGMYYCYWKNNYISVQYLNFNEHVFDLRLTKPWQCNSPQTHRERTGPEMTRVYVFDELNNLILSENANDNFVAELAAFVGDYTSLTDMYENPINVERLLEISLGKIKKAGWRNVKELSYFHVDDREFINRISYAQDMADEAATGRRAAISVFGVLIHILRDSSVVFPLQIRDLKTNSFVGLVEGHPNSNLFSEDLSKKALVAYIGENPLPARIQFLYSQIVTALKREDVDDKKIILCFKDLDGRVSFYPNEVQVDVTKDPGEEMISITRGFE